ncbi:hypothetical protein [Rummeliibacillus sp. TYF-LIM-RU47]|uniref:hypothetical protein n=1 Tax=Rummeliibacillus sp. TYF-LIM-RU47 TaxID=2608406 RepID=UPI001238A815|nr:hypothetical protein [Rummeliibacillus sp. TYF-LIM-RU47]
MKYDEIEQLLKFNELESKVFIPNEIFKDLQKSEIKSLHVPVAYCYYYLTNWLYRYTKYDVPFIDNKQMKEILGYHKDQKTIDYIIKKDGLLDQIGYTQTVKDLPLLWEFDEFEGLKFSMLSEMDEFNQKYIKEHLSRKYSIKYPVKAFERAYDDEGNIDQEGTFYDVSDTHCIPFEVFIYCMSNEKLGCTAFYLYSYISRMNDKFDEGWDIPIKKLIEETNIPKKTLERYLDQMKQYKMIEVIYNQEYFCLALDASQRKANTYIINEFDQFTSAPVPYEKLKVITTNEYYKQRNDIENIFGIVVEIPLEELPY